MMLCKNVALLKEVVSQAARRSVRLYFEPLVHVISAVRKATKGTRGVKHDHV